MRREIEIERASERASEPSDAVSGVSGERIAAIGEGDAVLADDWRSDVHSAMPDYE